MGQPRRMTDLELKAYEKQRAESRKGIVVLVLVVGGLSALAVGLAASSRAKRQTRELAAAPAAARPAPAATAPAPAPEAPPAPVPASAAVPTQPLASPPPADSAEVQRQVREQKLAQVKACVVKTAKRAKRAAQVTVKLDLRLPDKLAKLDVVTTPRSPALVKCVKAEFKNLVLPTLASNMTVSVPFRLEGAKGRRRSSD